MTPRPVPPWAPATPAPSTPARAGAEDPWVPAGCSVKIKGLLLRGGLLYVGRHLDPVGFGRDVEPALIDPSLPVFLSEADLAGSSLGYALSYGRISPRARAGYLHWLWTGRKDPAAPIGYVYLYFFGLERRVLHDRLIQATQPAERAAIRAEVERLLATYGTDDRFRTQAGRFAECLEVLARLESPAPGPLPEPTPSTGELPPVFRLELGRLAAGAGRLPGEWALAWVRQAPDIRLRLPAERCPEEFDRLFLLRYGSRFGDGLALADTRTRLRLYYRPASPSFTGEVRIPVGDLPDPSVGSGPTRKLADLARSVSDELSSYSRLVTRHPEKRGSLSALALLPAELAAGGEAEAADRLVERAEAALGDAERALVDVADLVAGWPDHVAGGFDREQATTVARLLAGRGIGVEPDVRFGGPPFGTGSPGTGSPGTASPGTASPGAGSAVLFRTQRPEPGEPDAAVTIPAAAALVRLAALVAGAGREVTPTAGMADVLGERVAALFDAIPLSRERVAAKVWWALLARPGTSGQKRRLATLDESTRVRAGAQLVRLAAGGGRIGPTQMAALDEAFRLLGLDPGDLFSTVHQATMHQATMHQAAVQQTAVQQTAAAAPPPEGLAARLDTARIRARLAETADVAAFLGEIFVDEDPPAAATTATTGLSPAGLDAPHSELLRRLAARTSWSRVEVEGLAGEVDLLPDGALDVLNEAAIERTGEPVCEGGDPVEINAFALEELLP